RAAARLDLARFYLARELYVEAKGVLDVTLGDQRPTADDTSGLIMRAVANLMLRRSDEALKDLANPLIGNQHDAQIWRAMAYTEQGKWAEAREAFSGLAASIGTLPLALREIVLRYRIGDLKAADVVTELETLTTVWRGDDTEIEALQLLARLYTEAQRYRDAFHVMRTAMKAHPNSEMTRRIQEEAAATFDA